MSVPSSDPKSNGSEMAYCILYYLYSSLETWFYGQNGKKAQENVN